METTYRRDERRLLRHRVEELEAEVEVLERDQDDRATQKVRVELDRRDARIEELEEERERMVSRLAAAHVENGQLRQAVEVAEQSGSRPGSPAHARQSVVRRGATARGAGAAVLVLCGCLSAVAFTSGPDTTTMLAAFGGLLGAAVGFAVLAAFWDEGR